MTECGEVSGCAKGSLDCICGNIHGEGGQVLEQGSGGVPICGGI